MKLGGFENKARVAMALLVLALLSIIGLSLALYWEARREIAAQRLRELKIEAALLTSTINSVLPSPSDGSLGDLLQRNNILAAAAIYSAEGELLATASTIDHSAAFQHLAPRDLGPDALARRGEVQSLTPADPAVNVRSEGGFGIAESRITNSNLLILVRPLGVSSSPFIFYVFSYNVVAILLGLALLLLLVRWMLRPYRRMVEAAQGSPVRASSSMGESEFVVQTFQALIERLQAKERELAQMHTLERRRAERSERFSERLISNIPSGLVTVDSTGLVTSANASAGSIFGLVAADGQPAFVNAIEPGSSPVALQYREFFRAARGLSEKISACLSEGRSFRREEVDVVTSDGRIRHLGLSVTPITDSSHAIEGALCLMTDITEVIELRERMKLQESLANLGEMAAGLAHEFKNSLATIQGYIQLLDTQLDDSNKALDATLNEVRLLARLVTDFLNFARPQHLSLTEISLNQIIKDCVAEVKPQLDAAGVNLKVEGEFAEIAGDESLLRRVFVNLLRNAAEAIDANSAEKEIAVIGSVDVGAGRTYAHVRVSDTGGGISTEDLHRIFIPFFTTKSRGYGIGLAIVQKILMAHGGDVSVEKSDSAGTVFHCRLPLKPASMDMKRA